MNRPFSCSGSLLPLPGVGVRHFSKIPEIGLGGALIAPSRAMFTEALIKTRKGLGSQGNTPMAHRLVFTLLVHGRGGAPMGPSDRLHKEGIFQGDLMTKDGPKGGALGAPLGVKEGLTGVLTIDRGRIDHLSLFKMPRLSTTSALCVGLLSTPSIAGIAPIGVFVGHKRRFAPYMASLVTPPGHVLGILPPIRQGRSSPPLAWVHCTGMRRRKKTNFSREHRGPRPCARRFPGCPEGVNVGSGSVGKSGSFGL